MTKVGAGMTDIRIRERDLSLMTDFWASLHHYPRFAFLFQSPKFDSQDQISRQQLKKKSPSFKHMIIYTRSNHEDDDVHVSFIMMGGLAL